MPFPMKIQPLDSQAYRESSIRSEVAPATAKPILKSRLKKLFDGVLKNSSAEKPAAGENGNDGGGVVAEFEPSSVCLAKMVRNFIEESANEKQSAVKCGRNRCSNCFNGNSNDSSDDEFDMCSGFGDSITAPSSADSLDILKSLIQCASLAERHLLADTSKILDKNKTCKRKDDLIKIVTDGLLLLGHDASICKSRWEKSPSFPAGEYEYIDVIVDGGERIFVDIDFRSEFEMARPTGGYKSILQSLPHIFVGRSDRLLHIVSIVSEAARQSIKERGMHLPPWRKAEYMRAKWLSPHSRITAAAVAQPDATVLKEESLSGDLELIFSKETSSGKDIGAVGSEALSPVENLGEEKKYTWQPPAIERKCCERGTKVVNGLASLLGERLSSCGDERITVFTTNHNRMDSEICRELRECKLFPEVRMNPERCSENFRIKAESCWDSVELEHPATLEELGMDPENKGLISDFLGFVRDKEFHKSMGRSCGDNCLVYNSPGGTERSSVIAAMANYLKFDIYHLDLTNFSSLSELFNMLLSTKNRSVIAIEGLYQCAGMLLHLETDEYAVHLLLNEIDKQSFFRRSNERIIVFTTNHRDQHDAASLRPVGMDIYIHMSSPQPIALPDGAYHNSLLVSNSEKENTREAYDSTKPYSLPNFDATGNKAVKVDSRWGRECWHSMELEQPPTFAELGKDPENEGIISDLLSFIRDKELYKRIGKIWTRGYLLCDSPGTNRWSLIAAMANCLEFDNYDLDLTGLSSIEELLNVLISIRNRSLIVIKDFDHWFEMHPNLKNEVFPLRHEDEVFPLRHENELTLSGLFEIIDGLVSCCWDEQIIVLTTSHNHRDRPLNLDAYMHTSSPRPIALPYGGEIVLLDSSEQKPLVDFDAANNMAYQGSVLVSNSEKENMRETSKRQCMTESVLSPDDSTTRISFTDFDAPDYRADLVRAYQSGPIMFTSENKDTRDGLYGECLTKSVLSDDDSTKQELLPEHTNLVFFSELTSEDINGFYDFVDSDSDDFDKFDDGAGMLPNVKDEFVDDLSSSCGDERITVSSTNQRDPHDAALLPLVNMDTDIHTASPQPIALPHSGEIVQLDSSEQKSLVDFDATNNSAYQSGVLLSSEKTNTIEACKGRWESLIQRTKKDMGEGLNGECLAKSILNLDDSTKRSSANTRRGRGCLPSIELEQPANNHHVGSAPSVNPSLWDRRHPCSGESPNAAGFHPGSLGKMRISNSPIHLDFVSQNMFPHVGGNCMDLSISSKNVGLHSPHLMFPGRGQISPVMSSFDSPNEWTRSRRNDGNSNQADSKKLYDLDIDRIGRGQDNRTTLVIKNIPNNFKHRYTSKMLLAAIDEGHRGTYDFVYLPIDFKNKCNVGYAFINMTDPSLIIPFYQAFNGKKWEKFNSEKVASLAYARIQGKAALIAHLQNSSLMNEDKRCRPILLNTDGPNAGDQFASSSRWPINLPYGIHIVVLDPLEQSTQNVAHAAREDQFSPTVSLPEKKMVRKALKRECRTWSVLFEIHQQHFGIRCEGAAKSFHATRICRKHRINRVSTVKRIHKHGIHQWPVRQKSRKEYHRGNKRPFKLSSVSMDDKLDSKLQFIHMSQFARSSPQPLVVLDGGEIVRPTALSSSEFAAPNNIAHLVGQDQSSYTASHYEGISRREMSDKQGLTMSLFSVGDFQQHFGCKHKDAVKRLRVISMFKSTCRQHWVYWWPCRFEYIERQAFDATNNRAKLVKADQSSPTVSNSEKGSTREALKRDWLTNVPGLEDLRQYFGARRKDAAKGLGDFLSWKSFKVLESLPLGEQSNDIRHSVRQRTPTHKHCVRQKISQDLPQSLQRYCSGGLAAQPAIGLPDGRHILSLSEKKIVGKTFKRKCRPMSVLSLEHHQQHADRRWEDPGKSLGAKRICRQLIIHRASTVKRVRRQHGIHRWPFQQNWETMKGYSLQEERPDDVISSSTNGKLVSRLQLIHISWLGRFSPRPPALPPGGEIVGPLALSSSQLPSTSNRAQLVGQDQSGSTASHSEKKRTREPEGLKGTTKNFTIEDLQPYVGLKRADAANRLCISESSFKRTCRKLGIERWPYFPTGEVWKPPDPHEKNTRQIEMVNEVVGHLPEPIDASRPPDPDERNTEPTEMENEIDRLLHEPNEFLQGFSDDPICWNTENGSTVEISETPTIFDSMDLDIEFGMENFEEARGSRERVFQVTYETTLSTAYPNPNPNEFVQPQVASTQFVSGNMRIPNDQRNSSASQAETRLEGHGTGSTCSNLALSQPMFTLSQMMPPFTSSQDTRSVRLKVYYGSEIIIFQFPLTSGINELKGEVAMRLNLEQDSFNMKYEDDEGEKILIPIDKDLRNYLSSSVNPVIKLWIANKVANPTNLCESCGGSLKR